jgi:glutamate racemase
LSVPRNNPVAVFDSGVGGLSVLRHLCQRLPHERILYLADQAHVPYGPRPDAEVRHFAQEITRFFLKQRVKLIVVACNRASAAALDDLRATFPALPFVGMEPAVKPAAAQTRSGKIGVLATAGTFESRRYANLRDRFARQITVLEDSCAGLVPLIERGQLATPETATLVTRVVAPMLDAGADTLVLGCTHYPFVRAAIEAAVQALTDREVSIIDPAPICTRQMPRPAQLRHLLRAIRKSLPRSHGSFWATRCLPHLSAGTTAVSVFSPTRALHDPGRIQYNRRQCRFWEKQCEAT